MADALVTSHATWLWLSILLALPTELSADGRQPERSASFRAQGIGRRVKGALFRVQKEGATKGYEPSGRHTVNACRMRSILTLSD